MKQLIFDKTILEQNIAAIQKRADGADIFAVLLGDAYGAGLLEFAAILRRAGIGRFAVDDIADARRLRQAGYAGEPILMLRSTTDRQELGQLLELGVICTIGSAESGAALNAAAEGRDAPAEAHVLVDTGMGFGGFLPNEPEKLLSVFQNLPNVAITGTYTHLYAAGRQVQPQLAGFRSALDSLHAAGCRTGIIHAAGSCVLTTGSGVDLDAVRVGSAFLGRDCPTGRAADLRPVSHGEASLDTVRWLPKGSTVGDESLVTLRQATRVGVIPVGYLHGFGLEHASRGGLLAVLRAWRARRRHCCVYISGHKARILGRIGATQTAVNVTDVKCAAGDTVVFDLDPLFAKGLERVYR